MAGDNRTLIIALAVAVLLLLIGVIGVTLVSEPKQENASATSAQPAGAMTAPKSQTASSAPAGAKIRVGLILSDYNATGPSWVGKSAGYTRQVSFLRELKDPTFEVVPLIDTGSLTDPDIARIVNNSFKGRKAIEVSRTVEMDTVDVIVAPDVWNVSDELMAAIARRTKAGGGFLFRQGFGNISPGKTPQLGEVLGLSEGQYGWNSEAVDCTVVQSHPLLGTLKPGDHFDIFPNGGYGVIAKGTGLIKVTDQQQVSAVGADTETREDFVHFPLYIAELEKGKIVGCAFARYRAVPDELNAATGGKFTIRCVKWLAGKPLD